MDVVLPRIRARCVFRGPQRVPVQNRTIESNRYFPYFKSSPRWLLTFFDMHSQAF
jgi:hypothetical protein